MSLSAGRVAVGSLGLGRIGVQSVSANGSSRPIASAPGDDLAPCPQSAISSAAPTDLGWFGHPSVARGHRLGRRLGARWRA